jgi:WD40 repeat protein
VTVSPDGRMTAIASCQSSALTFSRGPVRASIKEIREKSGETLILETTTGKLLHQIRVAEELELLGLTFSPNGKHIAVGGFGTVRVWEVGSEKAIRQF